MIRREKYPAGYNSTAFHCRLSISGVTTIRPCAGLVGDRNWNLASISVAPSGTSIWKACTSTGSRRHLSSSPCAWMTSPANNSIEASGEW
jgi:hypothetical protein